MHKDDRIKIAACGFARMSPDALTELLELLGVTYEEAREHLERLDIERAAVYLKHLRPACSHVFAWHGIIPPTHCPLCGELLGNRASFEIVFHGADSPNTGGGA